MKNLNMLTLLSVAAMTVAAPALAQDDQKVMAVSIPAATHGWTGGVVYHAEAAAAEIREAFPNIDVVVSTSPSAIAQVGALEDLQASRDPDALVILPFTSEELTGPVETIKNAGTFVAVVDRGLTDPSIQDLYVAGDNIAVGSNTADWLAEQLGGEGDVVVLRGIPTVIDDERIKGFQDALEDTNITILDVQYANWNRDEAFNLMQDYLAKYSHIDAVWANDDDMLLGVLEAIDQAGRDDIKFALGANGMVDIIERVRSGDPRTPISTPYPPSMIKTAMYLTAANLNGQAPIRGEVILDAPLINIDNADEFYFPDSPF